jgi:hypothetical protein
MQLEEIPRLLFKEFRGDVHRTVDNGWWVAPFAFDKERPNAEIVLGQDGNGHFIKIFFNGFEEDYLKFGRTGSLEISIGIGCLWVEGTLFDFEKYPLILSLLKKGQELNNQVESR